MRRPHTPRSPKRGRASFTIVRTFEPDRERQVRALTLLLAHDTSAGNRPALTTDVDAGPSVAAPSSDGSGV